MSIFLLSVVIISLKIVSLICLLISIYSYDWFEVENHTEYQSSIESLCESYGAFCTMHDPMPLPRLILIIPCVLTAMGLLLEMINIISLCSIWQRVRSLLNFFLEQTNIALTCALTIHCTWIALVHIRISMEMSIVHLHWTFYSFALAAILIPIDCICSIVRIMYNCQYGKSSSSKHHVHAYTCRHRSIVDSDT